MSNFINAFSVSSVFFKSLLLSFGIFTSLFYSGMLSAEARCLPAWIAELQALPDASQPQSIEVNKLSQPEQHIFNLKGQVHISQPGIVLLSDYARIDQKQQTAESWGTVRLFYSGMIITANEAILDQSKNEVNLQQSQFQFTHNRSHGRATTVLFDKNQDLATLTNATYTTCPIINQRPEQEGKVDWQLNFSKLDINNQTRRIYGYHARLDFKNIPIFYTPYISFPMDERASGLLFPKIAMHKSFTQTSSDFYIYQPLYINLAPHYDATLTLIKMQDRGLVLENEFRYRQPKHSAVLTLTGVNDQITQGEGIAHIDRAGNVQYGEKTAQRWRGKITANQQWSPNITSNVLWHDASDYHFYDDIPVELGLSTATQVQRHINLSYRQGNFNSNIKATSFLRLRKYVPYNYEKRPQINLNYWQSLSQQGLENLSYNLSGQITEFAIPFAGHNRPEATRTVLRSSLKYANYQPFGQLEINLIANQINYKMQDNGNNNTGRQHHQISVPQFAIKTGLNFERSLSFGETNLIQTLEPKIQYLYVPYQNQSKIPLFDTGARSLDFLNIFSHNRFSGSDRIGDANQISVALTSRFLKQDGSPLAEAGIGQIFYLADRKVQLTSNIPKTAKVSDYFVKLGATFGTMLGSVYFASTSQYSHESYEVIHANNRLRLDLNPSFKLKLAHQVSNHNQITERQNISTGFNWQINPTWSIGSYWSYWNYGITQERTSGSLHALRYDSCCWASELSIQETRLSNGLYNYSIQYVFELKGLSSIGTTFKDYLGSRFNF